MDAKKPLISHHLLLTIKFTFKIYPWVVETILNRLVEVDIQDTKSVDETFSSLREWLKSCKPYGQFVNEKEKFYRRVDEILEELKRATLS